MRKSIASVLFLGLGIFMAYNGILSTYNCWEDMYFYKKDMCFMINKGDFCFFKGRGDGDCEIIVNNSNFCLNFPEFLEIPCYKMVQRNTRNCTLFLGESSNGMMKDKKYEAELTHIGKCGMVMFYIYSSILSFVIFNRIRCAKNERLKTKTD